MKGFQLRLFPSAAVATPTGPIMLNYMALGLDACRAAKSLLVERPMGRDAVVAAELRDAFFSAGLSLFCA